jgi:hypothetical protein
MAKMKPQAKKSKHIFPYHYQPYKALKQPYKERKSEGRTGACHFMLFPLHHLPTVDCQLLWKT